MAARPDLPVPPLPPAAALLAWYDRNRRRMPWRATPGESVDPYRVWLSEIMLQQTTVATVKPYFTRFLAAFPDVHALAAASEPEVLVAWAGLGYYARARNLHACARAVSARGGRFPPDQAALRQLPGIGPYTAAAIASIAFDQPAIPVDGNVERVTARLFAIEAPLPASRPAIKTAAAQLGHDSNARARPSDFTQALFDLGATICTPRRPLCALCPWTNACRARQDGSADSLPRRTPRPVRPHRFGVQFWLEDDAGTVLLRRRAPGGLLGGMLEFPGTSWVATPASPDAARLAAPQPAEWHEAGVVRHAFTHFQLELRVLCAKVDRITASGEHWAIADLASAGLPTVMKRCWDVAGCRGGSCRIKGPTA